MVIFFGHEEHSRVFTYVTGGITLPTSPIYLVAFSIHPLGLRIDATIVTPLPLPVSVAIGGAFATELVVTCNDPAYELVKDQSLGHMVAPSILSRLLSV